MVTKIKIQITELGKNESTRMPRKNQTRNVMPREIQKKWETFIAMVGASGGSIGQQGEDEMLR